MDRQFISKAMGKLAILSGIAAGLMMISTVVNSFDRYILGNSIPGVVEINEFLLVVIAFSALAWTQSSERHVNMDFVVTHLSSRTKRWVDLLALVLTAAMLVLLTISTFQGAVASTKQHEIVLSVLPLPKWIIMWFIPVGSLGMLLVVLEKLVWKIISIFERQNP